MIIDFTASNFRSIKEPQTISFEATDNTHLEDYYVVKKGDYRLLKMATIIGANASGKSNILQAYMFFLRLMRVPCENKTDKIVYDKFALDEDCTKQDTTFTINFIFGEYHYKYQVVFNNEMVVEETLSCKPIRDGKMDKVFVRETNKETRLSTISLYGKYKIYSLDFDKVSINLLHNRTVFGAYLKSNVDIPCMKEIEDWIVSYCLPIVTTTEQGLRQYTSNQIFDGKITKEQVASFLRKADVGITDFSVRKEDTPISPYYAAAVVNDKNTPDAIKEQAKNTSTIPDARVKMVHNGVHGNYELEFEEESRGTQRYYEMAGVLLTVINTPHIVAIDELEYAMHPDLYEHFLVTFLSNAKESQILCTTHMREFLSDKNLFRDDSVWIAQKDERGATEVYSIADFDDSELQQIDSRYGAYRSGRLGGIPRLGDTYVEPLNTEKR
jgi:AAA15 family ATPase/GTPase